MGSINIKNTQDYVDSLYATYKKNEEEKRKLLQDPKVQRYDKINIENESLMMLLQDALFKLKTLKMEACDHVFLRKSNETHSWNECIRCGATNKYKVLKANSMSLEEQELFSVYKKSASHGVFLESEEDLTDTFLKDIYNEIITLHPDATQEQIVNYLDEYLNIKKQDSR